MTTRVPLVGPQVSTAPPQAPKTGAALQDGETAALSRRRQYSERALVWLGPPPGMGVYQWQWGEALLKLCEAEASLRRDMSASEEVEGPSANP